MAAAAAAVVVVIVVACMHKIHLYLLEYSDRVVFVIVLLFVQHHIQFVGKQNFNAAQANQFTGN